MSYIDREKLIEAYKKLMERNAVSRFCVDNTETIELIEEFTDEDVALIKHGKWIDKEIACTGVKLKVCSECKDDEYWQKYYCHGNELYCPNCGADMREDLESGEGR